MKIRGDLKMNESSVTSAGQPEDNNVKCSKIAKWVTQAGLEYTTNGSYYAYFDVISQEFNVSTEWIRKHAVEISGQFDSEVVLECEVDSESFSLMFDLQCCCEHCITYKGGERSIKNCRHCECWCSWMGGRE